MPHEPFEAQLHELLDRRQRPEECDELRALAETSPHDREVLAAQQRLFDGLEADEIPELPGDFAERVVAAHCAAEQIATRVPAKKSRNTWVWELATVAALVLAVIGGASYLAPPVDNGNMATLPDDAAKPASIEAIAHERPVDSAPTIPKETSIVDSPPPSDEEQHVAEDPHATAGTPRYDEIYHAFLDRFPNRQRPQWVDEVAIGLRPVAASFGGAINTLRSTLPASSKSERSDKPQAGLFELSPLSAIV